MSIIIRRAQSTDAAEVAELFIASQADALPFLARLHTPDETRAFITYQVFPRCDVWVAERDGDILGMIAMAGHHIDHLYLRPGLYRQGIGTVLLKQAKKLSPFKLTLFAFQVNARARAFYEHHGFRAVEFSDGHENEAREPDVLYQWP